MSIKYQTVGVFADELRAAPVNIRRNVSRAVRQASNPLMNQMRQNASWSTRIPGAIRGRASASGKLAGAMVITVDSTIAPHARPYEGADSPNGFFRHPVFGNEDVWVSEPTRPFFFPAVQQFGPRFQEELTEAVVRALPMRVG